MYCCDNCHFRADADDMNEAKDLLMRLDVGGIFTDRECPKCGALAFPEIVNAKPNRIAISVKGGVVQDVISAVGNQPLEIAILDLDTENGGDRLVEFKDFGGEPVEAFATVIRRDEADQQDLRAVFAQLAGEAQGAAPVAG
ncbi:MAG: hypothetical protein E6Q76_05710 [Rhizobium sp.]|nr:MAG: hypothetical protein E6Q76_05710 [Rhizobium sp.]